MGLKDKLSGPTPESIVQRVLDSVRGEASTASDVVTILNFLDKIIKGDRLNVLKAAEDHIDYTDMIDSLFIKSAQSESIDILDYFLENYRDHIKNDSIEYAKQISNQYDLSRNLDYFNKKSI